MLDNVKIPDNSKWYEVFKFPFFNIAPLARIENDPKNRLFWGFLDVDIKIQIGVTFLTIVPLIIYLLIVIPELSLTSVIVSCLLLCITYFLFLWSYYASSFMDPGFLPFDWCLTQKPYYDWKELLSGTVINERQEFFALQNKPDYASFSKSMGRYVIRADHICGWINNWVGKKNHKQFILLCFWGFIYSLILAIMELISLKEISVKGTILLIFCILLIFFELSCNLVLLYTLFFTLKDLLNNTTKVKTWKGEKGNELSHLESIQEVFGKGPCYQWFIPTPAFRNEIRKEEFSE